MGVEGLTVYQDLPVSTVIEATLGVKANIPIILTRRQEVGFRPITRGEVY